MKHSITPVTQDDRIGDSTTMQEDARERLKNEIAAYIKDYGFVNIRKISQLAHITPGFAKQLVNEITDEWVDEESDQLISQIKWYEQQVEELEDDPTKFNEMTELQKTQFRIYLFGEINRLRLLKLALSNQIQERDILKDIIQLKSWGTLKPRTQALIDARINETARAAEIGDSVSSNN